MTNSENRTVKKDSVYEEFIVWTSMPPSERHKLGIETQQQFSDYYHISINTPTAWKKRADFQSRVTDLRKESAFEKTSIVIESILRGAVKGSSASQKLWLQYFHNFPKNLENEQPKGFVHHSDIRLIIDMMPPDMRTKFYQYLSEINDAVQMLIRTGEIKDGPVPEEDRSKSLIDDEEEGQRLEEAKKKAIEDLKIADALPLEERSMANIRRRGI